MAELLRKMMQHILVHYQMPLPVNLVAYETVHYPLVHSGERRVGGGDERRASQGHGGRAVAEGARRDRDQGHGQQASFQHFI